MDKLLAARNFREEARTSATHTKIDRLWIRWKKFLKHIELNHDEFLDILSKIDRVRIIGSFAQAIRDREFSRLSPQELASSTCKEAVDKVAEVFRKNYGCNPRHSHAVD